MDAFQGLTLQAGNAFRNDLLPRLKSGVSYAASVC